MEFLVLGMRALTRQGLKQWPKSLEQPPFRSLFGVRNWITQIIYIISLVACVRLSDTTVLHLNSPAEPAHFRPWRSSGFGPPGLGANRRAKFPVPSLWAKLLEEIRLRHSSAERRSGIADVKNEVTGRVRSGLSVTELGNFCSREHPLREVISSHFSESFSSSTMSVCLSSESFSSSTMSVCLSSESFSSSTMSHFSESFSSSTMSVWQAGQGGQAKRPGKF